MQGACRRCPKAPMGCWPNCLYPSVSWTSDSSVIETPQWVNEWEAEMDRRALKTPTVESGPIAFERAAKLVAQQLASFRLGLDCDNPFDYTENEKLMAGHIIGSLWANDLLNTGDEDWISVESER